MTNSTLTNSTVTMSLNEIRAFHPCIRGWETLLKAQGKTSADDAQIQLASILESNGIDDAIWCFRVNWFQHKALYMKFINGCVDRAKEYASAANAAASAVAYIATCADAADANYAYRAASAAAHASKAAASANAASAHAIDAASHAAATADYAATANLAATADYAAADAAAKAADYANYTAADYAASKAAAKAAVDCTTVSKAAADAAFEQERNIQYNHLYKLLTENVASN